MDGFWAYRYLLTVKRDTEKNCNKTRSEFFTRRPASTEMAVNLAVNVQFSPLGANMAADRVTVRRLCSGKREGSRRA